MLWAPLKACSKFLSCVDYALRVQATVSHRVTLGRSAIHGFGLIAKRRLEEGEMVSNTVVMSTVKSTVQYSSDE